MPSLFPIKKRKYNGGEQEQTPRSSAKKKKSTDVIDMLSLQSTPEASIHIHSTSSSSSSGDESTLGSAFSPNMASIIDTQALTSASPDFQTQNSFVIDLQANDHKKQTSAVKEKSSFTLTRMKGTSTKNKRKSTPRRQSPRLKNPLPAIDSSDDDDDSLEDHRISGNELPPIATTVVGAAVKKQLSDTNVDVGTSEAKQQKETVNHNTSNKDTSQESAKTSKVTIASEAKASSAAKLMSTLDQKAVTNSNEKKLETSQGSEETSRATNSSEAKASAAGKITDVDHAHRSTVGQQAATSSSKKKEETSQGSEKTSKVTNSSDAKASAAAKIVSTVDQKAATVDKGEVETSRASEKTTKATNASGAKESAVDKIVSAIDQKAATSNSKKKKETSQASEKTSKATNASEAKTSNKNNPPNKKKRALQDKATTKPSTTTNPPKESKGKKESNQKKALSAADPVHKEVESTTHDKENAPAQQTKKTNSTVPPPEEAKPQPKKKKLTYQDQVFQHMMLSYKPFSMKSLAQELKTTEAALNFLMLSLVDKNIVVRKEFTSANKNGKSKELYWVNYDTKAKELQSHLATASEIQATQQEYDALSQELAQTQSMLAALMGNGPSNEDLSRQLEEAETQFQMLQSELNGLKGRIQAMQGGAAKEQNPKRLKQSINYMRDIWKKRREQCNDFIEQLADGMEKKPKEVIKLLELELDGDIQMPPKHKVE